MRREGALPLPASLQVRRDDEQLDTLLDALFREPEVRAATDEFNERVIRARYDLNPGPPLITMPSDVEATVAAWAERRAARLQMGAEEAGDDRRFTGRRGGRRSRRREGGRR